MVEIKPYSFESMRNSSESEENVSLRKKLYEEQRAFGMIDFNNFEREGLFETGF